MAATKIPFATLIAELANPNSDIRYETIKKIMRRKSERAQALQHLGRLLNDPDHAVRRAAVKALGRLEDARAFPYLTQALQGKSYHIRLYAVQSIQQLGRLPGQASAATTCLLAALRDTSESVRQAALSALLELGTPQIVPVLQTQLQISSEHARKMALSALVKINMQQARPHLLTALTDKAESVRLYALQELVKVSNLPDTIALLTGGLQDESLTIRSDALEQLYQLTVNEEQVLPASFLIINPFSQPLTAPVVNPAIR